jgi:ERCC4-type nuclease
MLDIIVDDREQAVIPYFNKFNFPPNITYSVSRVTTGDYSILYKNHVLFVIERKTWKDLAASIKDGRKHNVEKLLELRQSTGCHIIYLIEGNPLPNPNTNFCRVPYKNLRSHLDHLAFRDNIHMVYSKDEENTVSRIVEIINNYLTIKPSPLLKIDSELNPTDGGGVEKLKENKPISAESVIYKIWQCIPNITSKSSCLFVNKGWHISDLILGRINKNDIYTLKYPNGYIIGNRSDKIWNSTRLTDSVNPIFIKMLSQINGLTKQTAKTILEKSSFEKILLGEIPVKQISDIEKTGMKRKLGPKIASEIIKYFVKLVT